MLDIVPSYNPAQYQGKLMMQTWENGKNTNFKPNVALPIFFREFSLYYLYIIPSYHPIQFKGKLMNQTWDNYEKYNFGPNFGLFGPHLGHKTFFCGFYLY